MTCRFKGKLPAYLEEKLVPEEMRAMENHLEDCAECQQALDELVSDPLHLEGTIPEVEDEVLISKIKARIKGTRRIILYALFGFVLGAFSRFYTMDEFIVTKAIMALPYKLAEFVLGLVFAGNRLPPGLINTWGYRLDMGFFPYNPLLDLLASLFTPALIGSFLAMLVGYLVSDKRVFQRKKIINFLAAGFLTLAFWFAVLHGFYGQTLQRIAGLEGLREITIYQVEGEDTFWLLHLDQEALTTNYADFLASLTAAEPAPAASPARPETGFQLALEFAGGGWTLAWVDPERGLLYLPNDRCYQLAQEFLQRLETLAEVRHDG